MGCGLTKEKLQIDILVLQLEKAEIEEERERLIHQLEILERKKRNSLSLSLPNKESDSEKVNSKCCTENTE